MNLIMFICKESPTAAILLAVSVVMIVISLVMGILLEITK